MNTTMPTIGVISGGGFSETSLWTNASPTSNFWAQTVTLSDDITNYDYLKFKFRWSTTNDTNVVPTIIVSVSEFVVTATGENKARMLGPVLQGTGSTEYTNRQFYRVSDTSIGYSQGTNAGVCVPIEIIGLKA